MDDMFGTTCIDCGKAIDDSRPYSAAEDGNLIHNDCGDGFTQFRWRFYDEDEGDKWSEWHAVAAECSACCCHGPVDGEHQERCVYYDEFNLPVFSGHTRLHPQHIEDHVEVEWVFS